VDEKTWVIMESERYETLVEKESAYEATIKTIRDFVDEDNFLKMARENGYTDSSGYVNDWEGLFWFFHDHISSVLHYYDAMRERWSKENADCEQS
jgi:hypothetical protein